MTAESLRTDPRRIALLAGLCSLTLIAGALGFQYLGGVPPCEFCHWQRWAHIAAAIVGIVAVPLLPRGQARTLGVVVVLLILISGLIGAYQTGMQHGWLPGPQACTVDHPYIIGSNDIPAVRCDKVSANEMVFGLSLANYNAIFSFLIAGIAGFFLMKGRR